MAPSERMPLWWLIPVLIGGVVGLPLVPTAWSYTPAGLPELLDERTAEVVDILETHAYRNGSTWTTVYRVDGEPDVPDGLLPSRKTDRRPLHEPGDVIPILYDRADNAVYFPRGVANWAWLLVPLVGPLMGLTLAGARRRLRQASYHG